ncbi:uncharacterized protein LOC107272456 [Cephus cinctus]|uniref:Uncharacterized protein LOC107272456 n=1 Tax=Cephus cinctus TaxID=211228 RepID=A0AAJ7C9A5_CEPCN|nr:uncharacterized protein LOC107272456 [Cephus cinctus]XP_015605114.1 uncharacterized protein LOC107272456 [Cephus cinctus]
MDRNGSVNGSMVNSIKDVSWSTTELPLTPEEEEAIGTLVVIVLGIIVAIIVLFSMGIFIDCRHQKKNSGVKRKFKLKIPPTGRKRRSDRKSLASDMCPIGTMDCDLQRDAIV